MNATIVIYPLKKINKIVQKKKIINKEDQEI